MQLLLIQILHNFADVLRVLAGGDQERVIRFYDYQIVHTYSSDKFVGGMNIITGRIQARKNLRLK